VRAARILVTCMKESFTASQAAIASSSPGPRYHLVRESSYRRPVLVANINRLLVRQGRSYLYDPGTCEQRVENSLNSPLRCRVAEQPYKFCIILASSWRDRLKASQLALIVSSYSGYSTDLRFNVAIFR